MRLKVSEGCYRTFSQIILSAYNCSSVLPSWPTFSSSCWCPFLKSIPRLAWLTESKATRLLSFFVEDVAFISVGNDRCYYIWLTVAAFAQLCCAHILLPAPDVSVWRDASYSSCGNVIHITRSVRGWVWQDLARRLPGTLQTSVTER